MVCHRPPTPPKVPSHSPGNCLLKQAEVSSPAWVSSSGSLASPSNSPGDPIEAGPPSPPLLFQLALHPFHTRQGAEGSGSPQCQETADLAAPHFELSHPQGCNPPPPNFPWLACPSHGPSGNRSSHYSPRPALKGGDEVSESPGHQSGICCGSQETNTSSYTHHPWDHL